MSELPSRFTNNELRHLMDLKIRVGRERPEGSSHPEVAEMISDNDLLAGEPAASYYPEELAYIARERSEEVHIGRKFLDYIYGDKLLGHMPTDPMREARDMVECLEIYMQDESASVPSKSFSVDIKDVYYAASLAVVDLTSKRERSEQYGIILPGLTKSINHYKNVVDTLSLIIDPHADEEGDADGVARA